MWKRHSEVLFGGNPLTLLWINFGQILASESFASEDALQAFLAKWRENVAWIKSQY